VESDVNKTIRENKEQTEDNKINVIKKRKLRMGLAASRDAMSGNYMVRKPKRSKK